MGWPRPRAGEMCSPPTRVPLATRWTRCAGQPSRSCWPQVGRSAQLACKGGMPAARSQLLCTVHGALPGSSWWLKTLLVPLGGSKKVVAPLPRPPAAAKGILHAATAQAALPAPAAGDQLWQQKTQQQGQEIPGIAETEAPCLPSVGSSTDLQQLGTLQAQQAQQEGQLGRAAPGKRKRGERGSPSSAGQSLAAVRPRRMCRPAPWQAQPMGNKPAQAGPAMATWGSQPAAGRAAAAAALLGRQQYAGALAAAATRPLQAPALAFLSVM